MEKTHYPNAERRCINCRFYEVITNIQQPGQQASICRIEPPRMLAQLIQANTPQGPVPQWVPFSAWPIVGPNDWCGRFSKPLESVKDTRTPEQRLTAAAAINQQKDIPR